jgi:tetratricopeptide (TPR) repeat protein
MAVVAAWAAVAAAQTSAVRASGTASPMQGVKPTAAIQARLWLADAKDMDVMLVGVATGKVAYASLDAPTVAQGVVQTETIERAFFELALDFGELAQAERKRDWVGVYRILNTGLATAMPYLGLPDNNAVDPVMQMAGCMVRIAARGERQATTEEDRARAVKQYEAAYGVFQQLAKAEWSPLGSISVIKGAQCLLKMNKPKTAQFYLDEMPEPMPGDAAHGSYWLTRGLLAAQRGETRVAMDAAILSVDFENKDIETFPDALMLSARCYEELEEWHRARDVYFEVTSLFPNTDWADDAAARLDAVLKGGKTKAKEDSLIENVFFGVNEDIDELSRTLLKDRAKAATAEGEEPARRAPPKE